MKLKPGKLAVRPRPEIQLKHFWTGMRDTEPHAGHTRAHARCLLGAGGTMKTNSNFHAHTTTVALGGDWQGRYAFAQSRFASTKLVPISKGQV